MTYLLVAYAIFWGLSFLLILSIWLRQRSVEREIASLQELAAEQNETVRHPARHGAAPPEPADPSA